MFKIDAEDFYKWRDTYWTLYAQVKACNGENKSFWVGLKNNYKVIRGEKEIIKTEKFSLACSTFNDL